jgi:HEAT repeat protein
MHHCRLSVLTAATFTMVALSSWSGQARQPGEQDHPVVTPVSPGAGRSDEELLQSEKIATDGPSLIEFFRKRAQEGANRGRLQTLVAQLGDDDFEVREQASSQLVQIGVRAKSVLLEAVKDPDLEVAVRARDCLRRIDQGTTSLVVSAAARMLVERKHEGATEILLTYLPFAEDESIADDVRADLTALAVRDGRPDPALVTALTDRQPIKRAAAAEALCRAGAREPQGAVKALLKDADASVRLRVGLALCSLGDKEALPVLIDVLGDLPPQETTQLEEMLYRIAGDKAPAGDDATASAARRRYRDNWKKWWDTDGAKLDAGRLEEASKTLGYTLVLLLDPGKAVELDGANKPRWSVEGLAFPLDVEALPGDRLLSAEHRGNRVTERDVRTGKIVWEYKVGNPVAAQRLPNGNTFIGTQTNLLEVDKTGRIVWEYTPPGNDQIMKANKLRNGDIAMVTALGVTRFVLLDRDRHTEKRSFPVNLHTSGGRIDVLPNGNVIVPENANNRVVEMEPVGPIARVVWEAVIDSPVAAIRLSNGHTLITSMNPGRGAIEIDRGGRQVWSYKTDTRVTRAVRR